MSARRIGRPRSSRARRSITRTVANGSPALGDRRRRDRRVGQAVGAGRSGGRGRWRGSVVWSRSQSGPMRPDVRHELVGHLGERDLGDVELVLGDQLEEQIEGPLEVGQPDLEDAVGLIPLGSRPAPGARRIRGLRHVRRRFLRPPAPSAQRPSRSTGDSGRPAPARPGGGPPPPHGHAAPAAGGRGAGALFEVMAPAGYR